MKMLSLLVGMWAFIHLPIILPSLHGCSGAGPLKLVQAGICRSAARSAVSRPCPALIAFGIHLSSHAMAMQHPANN